MTTQPPACGKISEERLREMRAFYAPRELDAFYSDTAKAIVRDIVAVIDELLSHRHPAPVADERAEVGHTWDDLIALGDKFKLPVDVKIMAGTFTKGVKVGTMLRCVKHHAGYASEIPDSEYPTLGVWSPDIAALSAQPPGALEREKKCPHGYTGWCPECVDATPERAPGGDALNGMYGKHAVDGISALLKDAEPLHRDAFEHLEPVPHIATLINNNQFGWTNIIETAPNVTIDVGTKLYDQKALFAVGVAMLERGRKGGFEDGYIAGKAYQKHFASAPVADERADDGSLYLLGKWAAAFKSIVEQCAAPVDVSAQCDAVHFAYNTAKKALSAQPSGALDEEFNRRGDEIDQLLEENAQLRKAAPPPERAPDRDSARPEVHYERTAYCLMEMMKAYERRIRSDCTTPEQLAARPWECAEYVAAADVLKRTWWVAPPPSSSPSATADATLRAALEKLRTNIDAGLLTALRNGGQLDMDGCEVRVSRQACEEAADHLEQLAALAGNEGGK